MLSKLVTLLLNCETMKPIYTLNDSTPQTFFSTPQQQEAPTFEHMSQAASLKTMPGLYDSGPHELCKVNQLFM